MTSYSDLPGELQLEITQYLDVASLRSLRLVDKSCLPSASKRLFNKVELWPLIWSWTRLESMSASPFISDYVEALKFNANVLTNSLRSEREDLDWEGQMMPVTSLIRSILKPSHERAFAASGKVLLCGCSTAAAVLDTSDRTTRRLYTKYEAYMQAQDQFVKLDAAAIRDVIRGFKNLRTILSDEERPPRWTSYERQDNSTIFDRGKDFLDGPCLARLALGTHDTSCLAPFIKMCMSSSVYHLRLIDLAWYNLPLNEDERQMSSLADPRFYREKPDQFDDVRHLDLHLDSRHYIISTRMQLTYCKRLTDSIACYGNLETLNLSFIAFPWSYIGVLLQISASLAKLCLPRLRRLIVSKLLTTERSMIELLENNSATLKILELNDIGVGLPQSIDDRESVMSLFWNIRRVTSLETVKLGSLFTNLIDEAWFAERGEIQVEPNNTCFRTQLEDYMCHKTEWPVRQSLGGYLLSREAGKAQVKDSDAWRAAVEPLIWEDSSWKWSWEFLKTCRKVMLRRLGC